MLCVIFQAWIDNSLAYIEIGKSYNFIMNVTQGSDVTLSWIMEDSVNITETHLGDFTLASKSHTYNNATKYDVTVVAVNFISSASQTFPIYVLYNLSEVSFNVDSTLVNTVDQAVFNFTLSEDCKFPMGDVDFYIDFKHGLNISFSEQLNTSVSVPHHYTSLHLFDTQGIYYVESKAVHILGSKKFNITMEVWDSLDALKLAIKHQTLNVYVVNTSMTLEFEDFINAGFEYSIDYGDGGGISSNGTDILYGPYNLSQFQHFYTQADVYIVSWTAKNGHYNRNVNFEVFVQNLIQDFQVYYTPLFTYCMRLFCFLLHFTLL